MEIATATRLREAVNDWYATQVSENMTFIQIQRSVSALNAIRLYDFDLSETHVRILLPTALWLLSHLGLHEFEFDI